MLRRRRSLSRLALAVAPVLGGLWLSAAAITCAAGSGSPGTGGAAGASSAGGGPAASSSSSGSSSSGSSSGGGGGASSAASSGTGGAGGGGGSTSSSAASSSSASSASSSSGAPGNAHTIVSVYAEGNGVIGDAYNVPMMSGFATPWQDTSQDAIGLAFEGDGVAVAVVRSQPNGELHFARWVASWSPGFGATMTPVQAGLDIVGGPSIAGGSTMGHAVYQGLDLKFYYALELNASWSPANEPITHGATQSAGPVPPAITTLADDPIIAFVGNDAELYDQTRVGGAWSAASAHGVAGHAASVTPAIVPLFQGAELLVVYTDAAAQGLMYTLRTAGTWSAPAAIAGASSADQVSVAPLAAGGAVLVYRGTDEHLYTSLLAAGPPYTWSAPVVGVMGSDPLLQSPPAVATGATGAEAELLYLDTAFILYAARMTNGAWGAAGMEGAASYRLAIATGK